MLLKIALWNAYYSKLLVEQSRIMTRLHFNCSCGVVWSLLYWRGTTEQKQRYLPGLRMVLEMFWLNKS